MQCLQVQVMRLAPLEIDLSTLFLVGVHEFGQLLSSAVRVRKVRSTVQKLRGVLYQVEALTMNGPATYR